MSLSFQLREALKYISTSYEKNQSANTLEKTENLLTFIVTKIKAKSKPRRIFVHLRTPISIPITRRCARAQARTDRSRARCIAVNGRRGARLFNGPAVSRESDRIIAQARPQSLSESIYSARAGSIRAKFPRGLFSRPPRGSVLLLGLECACSRYVSRGRVGFVRRRGWLGVCLWRLVAARCQEELCFFRSFEFLLW